MAGIRPAERRDFPAILALNEDFVCFTSPLDGAALADLHAQAVYHRVIEAEGHVVAFLLALAPGQPYQSPNYTWFSARYDDFLYIDRVVVAGDRQRAGLGAALYDDVAAWAAERGFGRLVCEVNIEPPNPVSDAFHARQGFVEVGTQWVAGGTKKVSLREKVLAPGRRVERGYAVMVMSEQGKRTQGGPSFSPFSEGHEVSCRIFDALRDAIIAIGPVDIRSTTSEVAFRRRSGEAFAWVPHMYRRKGGLPLTLTVGLRRRDRSPRWAQVVEGSAGRFEHDLPLYCEADLDDEVREWLREAWEQAG